MMDQAAILDHQFRIAAYVVTWVIQLGYAAWLFVKWQSPVGQTGPRRPTTMRRGAAGPSPGDHAICGTRAMLSW